MTIRSLILGFSLVPLASMAAQASFTLPDCAAMTAWAGSVDLSDRQALNPSTVLGFPTDFLGSEMVALYGKAAADFTVEEAAAARQAAKDCGKQASDRAEKKLLAGLEKEFSRGTGGTLEAMAKAGVALDEALADFTAAPAGLDKMSSIAGFRAMANWDRDGFSAAVRRVGRDFKKINDRIGRALASLPQAAVTERVLPVLDPQYDTSRGMVLTDVREQLAALDSSERGLRSFDRDAGKIVEPVLPLLPSDDGAVLAQEVAARKAAIEQALIGDAMAGFEERPINLATLRDVEAATSRGLAGALSPQNKDAFTTALSARRQAVALALVESVSTDFRGLQILPQLREELLKAPMGFASETDLAAIEAAVAEKQAALGGKVTQDLLVQIEAVPLESKAFAALDGLADERALRLLSTEDVARIREAAGERRSEVGEELFDLLTDELDGFDDSEQSLAVIDTILLPDINGWPASAAEYKDRFRQPVLEKRGEILAELTEAESGPLRGRVYADRGGSLKLEFADGGKVYVSAAGSQTIVAAYEEDGETRVLVTLPQGTLVFTREARWLTGGPAPLERIDNRS
ncbi:hypothetical protein [Pelagibius sp. 7325]|uniref:hypothetical protein n=1 Tax=Pelagibius sp. 7325 TaxID=3131994 RepID=UPI0030EDD8AE